MELRKFGKTDMKVYPVGFGAWQAGMHSWGSDYSENDIRSAVETAISSGVNFFDTAEGYGGGTSEKILGSLIKDREVYIATKVAGCNSSRIDKSIESSHRRLGRTIDLYQLHWVPSIYTSLKKTMRSLENSVKTGYTRYIGLSNFPTQILKEALEMLSREEIVSNQVQYSILDRRIENSMVEFCRKSGIEIIAYSPMARGRLTGKYFDSKGPGDFARMFDSRKRKNLPDDLKSLLLKLSESHKCTISQISLAWVIAKGAFPIPGAKNRKQAEQNSASADVLLTKEELSRIDTVSSRYREGEYRSIVPRLIPNTLVRLGIGSGF
jgi:aryl-alcohol dehydrogenase-like predicted oxidoreductase